MPKNLSIRLSLLAEPSHAARATMDEYALEDLATSIKRMGVLQPLIVVPLAGSPALVEGCQAPAAGGVEPRAVPSYEIVAGHRRFLAARRAGLTHVPCVVYDSGSIAKEAATLHENVYREDLTAAEEGWFYCELIEKHKPTEQELCELVGQAASYVYPRIDLVSKDAEVAKAVAGRKISFSAAKEINKCDDEEHRRYLLRMACDGGASARTVESWVMQWKATLTPQLPGTAAAPAESVLAPPAANPYECFCCGQQHQPQLLKPIFVCWHELSLLKQVYQKLKEPEVTT